MNAAVLRGLGKIENTEVPLPKLTPDSVLLKIRSCAVCGSDIRIFNHGNERVVPPRIIGHEIAGDVVAVGAHVSSVKIGDRVSVGADVPCGKCQFCLNGRANSCDENLAVGYQMDGGFAQYMLLGPLVVNQGPFHVFSESLDYDMASLAEPLACCINGYEQVMLNPATTAVIFGAGPIGLMLGLLAPSYGIKNLVVIDPNRQRLALAKNILGCDVLDPQDVDVVQEVYKITAGKGAGVVFTACNDIRTHEKAIAVVAKRGVVNLFGGLPKGSPDISLNSNFIHYREAYVTGSHGSTPSQHKRALELLEQRKVDLRPLVSQRLPLQEIKRALQPDPQSNLLKTIIKPND